MGKTKETKSESIDTNEEEEEEEEGKGKSSWFGKKGGKTPKVQDLIIIFLSFVLINSDVFSNTIMSSFKGSMKGTELTLYGVILQGICLLVMYSILSLYI